jgi:membrane protein implicated in regulation of membrane protease activity
MVLLIGSMAATAVQAKSSFVIGILVTLFVFISLSIILFLITTDLLEESRQSVDLERRINKLSGCKEPLLTWETEHGAVNGLMRPFRKRRKPT